MVKENKESMGVVEGWFFSIKGKVNVYPCQKKGRWKEGESITNLPCNWPFIISEFHLVEGCCDACQMF